MSVLKVSSLYKSYGKRRVLDNFSLEIDTSEFVSLLGPSGCGKTTALKIISGFIKPDFGSVSIENFDVSEVPPEKRNTAMCFQSYALFPHLTVKENIKFGLHEKKIPQAQANILFEEAISQNLRIMDGTALTLAKDHKLPIKVFNLKDENSLSSIARGEDIGTLIS